MLKRDLAFLLALIVILFGIYWKTFNYDLIWDDASLFKHNLLFIEDHPVSTAFKMGYFSNQWASRDRTIIIGPSSSLPS